MKLEAGLLVALDTAPLIYLIEEHPDFAEPVRRFFDVCVERGVDMVTSMVTYIEVLTHPEKLGRHDLALRYRHYLTNSARLTLCPLDVPVADACVQLRAKYGFRTPDAIQLAVAIACGASCLLTNDQRLKRCEDVEVVLVSELPVSY